MKMYVLLVKSIKVKNLDPNSKKTTKLNNGKHSLLDTILSTLQRLIHLIQQFYEIDIVIIPNLQRRKLAQRGKLAGGAGET